AGGDLPRAGPRPGAATAARGRTSRPRRRRRAAGAEQRFAAYGRARLLSRLRLRRRHGALHQAPGRRVGRRAPRAHRPDTTVNDGLLTCGSGFSRELLPRSWRPEKLAAEAAPTRFP